jgi:hypothetical protein
LASVIDLNDTFIVAFIICPLSKYFKIFSIAKCLSFLKQILKEEVSCQQILFLSADSVSRFLWSADLLFVSRFYKQIFVISRFFFVSKCLCRRHLNDAHAGIVRFAPACFLTEKFSPSAGAHFRFYHNFIRFAGPSSGSSLDVQ